MIFVDFKMINYRKFFRRPMETLQGIFEQRNKGLLEIGKFCKKKHNKVE